MSADLTSSPPPLPINSDPKRALEQVISVLREIIKHDPTVRRFFDCEAFIKHELEGALVALSAPSAIRPTNAAEWDGYISFDSDCIVNGTNVAAGTSWGPFEKSRNIAAAPTEAVQEPAVMLRPECPGMDACLRPECSSRCAVHGPAYIAAVSVPIMEALMEPCKGCGKRPIDFAEGAEGQLSPPPEGGAQK